MSQTAKPAAPATPDAEATEAPATEGWGIIGPHDAVSHYYRRGNALCNARTLYAGELTSDAEDRDHSEDCGRCAFKLAHLGTIEPFGEQGDELATFEREQEARRLGPEVEEEAKGKRDARAKKAGS